MSLNEEQERIASTSKGILLVDAGPGTGKTHTIVERYIRILESGASPRDILMITFTRNAASEMSERICSKMKKLAKDLRDTDKDRSDELMKGLGDVCTSTFDAYCLRIVLDSPETVSEFFGIPETLSRGAKLEENETLNRSNFKSFYVNFLKERGHLYAKVDQDIPAVVGDSSSQVYSVIQKLMSTGIIPLKDDEWFLDGEKRLIGDMSALKEKIRERNAVESFFSDVKKGFEDKELFIRTFGEGPVFEDEDIYAAVEEDRRLLLYFIRDVYFEYIRASIRQNRLTFALTSVFAFITLYSDQRSREQKSVSYLMVDEFQDTNEMQMMICMMLMNAGNLCVVGDWKQGIYGFRFASVDNITMFRHKLRKLGDKLNADGVERVKFNVASEVTSERLRVNYRSSKTILDVAFKSLEAKATKEDIIDNTIPITLLESEFDSKYAKNTEFIAYKARNFDDECNLVTRKITEYMFSGRYCVLADPDTEMFRDPLFSDIAVLCRSGRACNAIYNACNRAGIPAFLQGDVEIMGTRPGKLVLAWLRFLNDRTDKRGLTTILVEENCTMSQINRIYEEFKKPADERKPMSEILPNKIWTEWQYLNQKRKRPNDVLTSIFAFYRIGDYDPIEADIAQAIISVVSSLYAGSLMTISDIIRFMEDDIENSSKYPVDAVLGRNAVIIQTMHKSKGLEYPFVIVADVNQKHMPSFASDSSLISYDEVRGLRLRKKYVHIDNGDAVVDGIIESPYGKLIRMAVPTNYDEERRLFFVSLSRAKQYLCLTCYKPSSFVAQYDMATDPPEWMPFTEDDSGMTLTYPPEIGEYTTRRKNVGAHDLMVYQKGGEDSGNGGIEYGNRVHEAAEQMALGKQYDETLKEVPRIREILNSLDGSMKLAEINCALPVGEVTVRGIIDLLADFDDHIEIHDYKTDIDDRNLDEYRLQLSIYATAVERARKMPVRCFVQYVSQGKTVEVDVMGFDEIERIVAKHFAEFDKPTSETVPVNRLA